MPIVGECLIVTAEAIFTMKKDSTIHSFPHLSPLADSKRLPETYSILTRVLSGWKLRDVDANLTRFAVFCDLYFK